MNQNIFKAYDVRGRYPGEINEAAAEEIARRLARHWKRGTIVVAHDARRSSPALYAAAIEGLRGQSGITVEHVGIATTPMFYFLVNELGAAGGIMITASHNPKEYNGLKIVGPRGEVISGEDVRELLK